MNGVAKDRYEALVLQETLANLAEQEGKLRAQAYIKESVAARLKQQVDGDATLKQETVDKATIEIQKYLDVARTARTEADEVGKRAVSVMERLEVLENSQNA